MVTAVVIAAHEIVLETAVPGSIGALVLIVDAAQKSGVIMMLDEAQQPVLRRTSGNRRGDLRLNPNAAAPNAIDDVSAKPSATTDLNMMSSDLQRAQQSPIRQILQTTT
ncbi:MAG: hypothetical protein K2X43_02900 [Hyphomonadaceae bacterium]|jgi:hypothetical protein|nr:hypothetical protein [Hyphomonadaceae bacterium]